MGQPPEKGDETRNTPKTRAEIGVHLLQALLPMKSTKANGPRPENQDQRAMTRGPRAVSQGLSVKAREPKLKSSSQEVRTELPSQDRVETREPKLGNKGQAGIKAEAQ